MIRPGLAIVANEQTPYRIHLHRRIVREIPEIRLFSVFTHEFASSPWQYREMEEIHPILFGAGESTAGQDKLSSAYREWSKGGRIIDLLRNEEIGAVVLFGYNDPARLRILRWCHKRRVPCFLFGDSNELADRRSGTRAVFKRAYVGWVIRRCAGVFHCGALGRRYFSSYGAHSDRLYPFPYEPDYASFANPDPSIMREFRARFPLNPARRRILFVGRMTGVKRPDLVLAAFERIAERRPDWDLIMVGDGPLRPALQQRLSRPELAGRISWAGFLEDTGLLAGFYASCDVFVLASDFEPWGVVLTEAAAHLALVASSVVGAAADLIAEGVNGKTFSPGDLNSLTATLFEVTSPDRIDQMKAASPRVLAGWRRQSDPIAGLRRALADCGVLHPVQMNVASPIS